MSDQTFKTEHEFHAARRMFLIFRGGELLLATKGDVRTHFELVASLFGSEEAHALIKNCTRGYVLGNRMVVYKGQDFSHWVDHYDVIHALDTFDRMVEGGIKEIGLGAVYQKGVQPWPPKIVEDAKEYVQKIQERAKNAPKLRDQLAGGGGGDGNAQGEAPGSPGVV